MSEAAELDATAVELAGPPTLAGIRGVPTAAPAAVRSDRAARLAEAGAVLVAAAAATLLAAGSGGSSYLAPALYCAAAVAVWLVASRLYGLADLANRRPEAAATDHFGLTFHAAAVASWGAYAVWALADPGAVPVSTPLSFWLLVAVVVPLARIGARSGRLADAARQRTVVLGTGEVARLIGHKIRAHPEAGLELVGFVDANPTPADGAAPLLGAPAELPRLVEELSVDRVIVAFSLDGHERLLHLVRELIEQGVEVDLVPRLFEMIGPNVKLGALEGVPLLNVPRLRLSRGSRAAKRAFDVALSGGLLLVLLPAFALIAIAIKLDSNGPVFFRQRRIGEDSRPFTMLKFRSMFVGADARKADVAHLNLYARNGDARMFKIEEDPRVTRVGNFLRRHCLDELPQLVNILRGDMSLVGPRPLIPEEDRYVVDWQRRRLAVKPGVTGLWQVLGCNEIPFDEMVKLDYLYVTGWSLLSDAQLLMRTATAVMRRRHSY